MRALTKLAFAALATIAVPCFAADNDTYTYKLELTSEEGPLDPAVEGRMSLDFGTCAHSAKTTLQSVNCQTAEFLRRDAELNRVWRVTKDRIARANHRSLLASQRRWIAARDLFCRKEAERYKGGTIVPVIYSGCRVELTIRRILWLESLK